MSNSLTDTVQHDDKALCAYFDAPLRELSRRVVRVWFNHERLDEALSKTLQPRLQYDLIYAIDTDGRQISSNVYKDSIDPGAYGQDLSQRPYSVPTAVLNNAAFRGVFVCDAYVSQVTERPCVTVLYGITSGPATLGFIAADIDLSRLPDAL